MAQNTDQEPRPIVRDPATADSFDWVVRAAGIDVPSDWACGATANYEQLKSDCEIVRLGLPPEIEPGFTFDPRKLCES